MDPDIPAAITLEEILQQAPDAAWLEELVDETEASRITKVPVASLQTQRVRGGLSLIPYIKLGKLVRYRRRDLLAHFAANTKRTTSDPGPAR